MIEKKTMNIIFNIVKIFHSVVLLMVIFYSILFMVGIIYRTILSCRKSYKLKIEGDGDHFIFFCHGLGGSNKDFDNLKKNIDLKKHTLILLGAISGHKTLKYDIYGAVDELIKEIQGIDLRKMKKISVVGHSLGGLYAKGLIIKMFENKLIADDVKLMNFVTFSTPHYGACGRINHDLKWIPFIADVTYNLVKTHILKFCMDKIGWDLYRVPMWINNTHVVINKFKNRINYVSVHFDRSVPFWSASMNLRGKLDDKNIKEYRTKFGKSAWRTYTVPLSPYHPFNHVNIVGKNLNGIFTFHNDRIKKVIEHFNKWFI